MHVALHGRQLIDLDSYKNVTGTIDVNGLCIGVTIKDARIRYGHLDFLVEPIFGSGEKWMENHKVATQGTLVSLGKTEEIAQFATKYPQYDN